MTKNLVIEVIFFSPPFSGFIEMDAWIVAVRSAGNADDVVKIICDAVESPDLYSFAELFPERSVHALLQGPHVKYHYLLQLFAYGILYAIFSTATFRL